MTRDTKNIPAFKSALAPVRAQHHLSREEDGDDREQKPVRVHSEAGHVSVMPGETLEYLHIEAGDVALDGTAGMGGHSEMMLEAGAARVIALDADPVAVAAAQKRLARFGDRALVLESNFKDAAAALAGAGVTSINKALFDLGWNSTQLLAGRGFSFMGTEPLNMSYGAVPASGFTAEQIVNTWSETVLADVLFGYGEERYARRIAKKIVEAREAAPIETTAALVSLINDSVPAAYRRGRIHPATRSFQALRIAVNDELGSIERGIAGAWDMLAPGGRIAVITFHSIEDRAVKRLFAAYAKNCGKLAFKKPLVPTSEEVAANPRSRSAKLRVIEKI
jgi:16S rRNA (cytosine1402-N4)-methyltransferase